MTYDEQESSRTKGKPASLYFFRYGDTPDAYIAYTDAERSVSLNFDPDIGTVIFSAIAIKRGAIVASGALDKAPLAVRTPHDADLADLFMDHPPSQVVTLTIWDGHFGEDDFALVWSGRVLSHASEGNEAVYTCEPISTSLKRTGLTRNYQISCPLVLYGPDCRADQEAATVSSHAVTVSGPVVSLPDDWAPADQKSAYVAGFATWIRVDGRTERRTIIKLTSPNIMVLSGTASGLEPSLEIKLTLGCPHDLEGCSNLHNNIQNYGGQWLIPTENPFGIKNNFN